MTPDREPWTQAASGIAAALPDLCFVIGPDLRYAACNHPDHADLHAPWPTLIGHPVTSIGPPALAQRIAQACNAQPQQLTYALRRRDGRAARCEARISPLPDGAGWLLQSRDLTADAEDDRHARAMRGSLDGLWEWALATDTEFFSPRACALLDRPARWAGRLADTLHADDQAPLRAALQSHRQHGAPLDIDVRLAGADTRWLRCRGWTEHDAQGRPARVLATLSDISVAKLTERALTDSQAKFHALFRTVPVGIALVDLTDDTVVEANDELARLLGWPPDALVGRSAAEVGLWADADARTQVFAPLATAPRVEVHQLELLQRWGQHRHGKLVAEKVELAGRALLLCAVTDISVQVEAQTQARALSQQLMDQERTTTRRLAQALHDQLGQTLTALRLTLDLGATPTLQARQLVDQALREVRQVLVDLRPPLLEDDGLPAALDNELAVRRALHPGVRLVLDTDADLQDLRWPPEVEYAVFMVAREGMENALQHAGRGEVRVGLQGDVRHLALTVEDDGPGATPDGDPSPSTPLGLIGMRERARAIGATLAFGPADTGGMRLALDWAAP